MVYKGLRLIMMGIFISELGSESSLKLEFDSDGLSGLILCEQERRRVTITAEIIIPFILYVVVLPSPKDSFEEVANLLTAFPSYRL